MDKELFAHTRGTRHTVPTKERDIQQLMEMWAVSEVHVAKKGRKFRSREDACIDLVSRGVSAVGPKMVSWWARRCVKRSTEETFE